MLEVSPPIVYCHNVSLQIGDHGGFVMDKLRVGSRVYFGRTNGEKTLGEILKMNPKSAKVRALEERGSNRPVGQVWNVAYSLLSPVGDADVVRPAVNSFRYNPFDDDNEFFELIYKTYVALSPEYLSCDGELSVSVVSKRRVKLNRRLRGLFLAIGREVSESDIYEWWRWKQECGFESVSA